VLTIRGRTGYVVAMVPMTRESADSVALAIRETLSEVARAQVPISFWLPGAVWARPH
jgi:hypothetical protein